VVKKPVASSETEPSKENDDDDLPNIGLFFAWARPLVVVVSFNGFL
jgi:hypothetical protein